MCAAWLRLLIVVCLALGVGACRQVLGIGDHPAADGGGGDDDPDADVIEQPDAEPLADAAPGTLGVTVAEATLHRGETVTVQIEVSRGDGVTGPAIITTSGLPTGVTAGALTIAAGETTGDLSLTASDSALLGATSAMVHAEVGAASGEASLEVAVLANPGTLDDSFGGDGVVTVPGATATDILPRATGAWLDGRLNNDTMIASLDDDGTVAMAYEGLITGTVPITLNAGDDGRLLFAGYDENGFNDDALIAAFDTNLDLDTSFGNQGAAFMGDADPASYALMAVPMGGTLISGVAVDGNGAFALSLDSGVQTGSRTNLGSTTDVNDALFMNPRMVAVGYRPGAGGVKILVVRSYVPGATTSSEIGPQTTGCQGTSVAKIAADAVLITGDCTAGPRLWQIKLTGTVVQDLALPFTAVPVAIIVGADGTRYVLDADATLHALDAAGQVVTSFANGGELDLRASVSGLDAVTMELDGMGRLWVLGTTGANTVVARVLL
jgi:hypothetical protein